MVKKKIKKDKIKIGQELNAFESDSSEKTKFMVVMNKANEGLHIDGVDGIIWFRALDENSRILYLQQLGRAIYALDEDNPLSENKRPIVIDLANNSLIVKVEKEFENIEPIDDLESLTIVIEWIEKHDGMLPDRNSSNKQEQHYYAVLRRIQNNYSKYLDGFDNFGDLTEEDKSRIQEIIELATGLDLWNIELPPIPKTIRSKDDFAPFAIEGVLKDYVEINEQVNIFNKLDDFKIAKQYIEFLKTYDKKPSPTFRKDGREIKKLIDMTTEQRAEKRLYSRWNETLIRKLVDKKLQNPLEEVNLEYSEVVEEIKELILQIESKENIEKIQDYVTFLETYGRKPQVCFKKDGRALFVSELTEEQKYEKNLGLRWRNSEIKKILDNYTGRPISDIPKYYISIIAKLRELGELGEKKEKKKILKREKPIEEEILEFLNLHNRMPLSWFRINNKALTSDEMNEEQKREVNLYRQWKRSKIKKYVEMELSEVPEECRKITVAISQKISDIKLYSEAEIAKKYIKFLENNERRPSNTITCNKKQLSVSEMTDTEKYEVNLANSYRKSKIKKAFEEFENGEIDNLPEMWMDIYNQINTLLGKINIVEETKIAKEYIVFVEKTGKFPRQQTSGKKQLKRQFKSDEQADEESLARRWTNSHIKTVFEEYLEQADREIPEEYKDIFSRLIELGLKSSKKGYDIEKNIVDQIIEFLNKYNAMPRGAIYKNGKFLNTSEMSKDEQEERRLYSRWSSSNEYKMLKKYAGRSIEEVPEEYRDKIAKLREYELGKKEITTYEEVIEFLESHDGRIMRSSKKCITQGQGEERKLYNRWSYSQEYKILKEYEGRTIEEVPKEYREKISRLREFGLGLKKSKLQQTKQQRDEAKEKNQKAKELELQVAEQLKKRGKNHEEQ